MAINRTFNNNEVLTAEDMNALVAGINEAQTSANAKQTTLVSGSNIKTINGQSILGSGNIALTSSSSGNADDTTTLYNQAKGVISRYQHQYILPSSPAADKEVDLILFTGQSNSCGRAQLADCKTPEDLILSVPIYKAFHFDNTSATEPQQIVEPIAANGTSTYGYIPAFLNAYYETTHRQVCACFNSTGGSNLNKFIKYRLDSEGNPTASINSMYSTAVTRVNYAKTKLADLGYTIGGIYVVWCQGENDAYYYGYANNYGNAIENALTEPAQKTEYYKNLFKGLVTDWQQDLGVENVFIISIGHRKENPTRWEMYGPIVQAQKELGKEDDVCVLATTLFTGAEKFIEDNGTVRNLMRDNTHYIPEGYVRAGLDAGVNAGVFVNSGKKIKPVIMNYESLLFDDGITYERPYDKFVYDPYRIDINLFKRFASDVVTSIALNFSNATLSVGENIQLEATIYPTTVSDKTVTYTSSDPEVVEVSGNGLLTAKATGSATITVTPAANSTVSATVTITVLAEKIPVESIELNMTTASMLVGDTLQLTATVLPENATDKTVTWVSSDAGAASVTNNGLVTALEQGDATITVTANGNPALKATCVIQLAHKVITPGEALLSLDFTKKTVQDYIDDGILVTNEASVDDAIYSEDGLVYQNGDGSVGLKLATPINAGQDFIIARPWASCLGIGRKEGNMSEAIIVALLGFAGTLVGSLFGILAAQKLTQYRLSQLEEKVNKHNNLVERTYVLEGQMVEVQHDIKDLKAYHKPTH